MTTPHIATATYRLQLSRHFTFKDALGLVDYLSDLGISDVYLSPITAARPGSLHGYDVIDPTRLNPELGTTEDCDAFFSTLKSRGMGLIVDVVPNHMCATDPGNRWWQDVIERGPASAYAKFFDINFHPAKIDLNEKILLPFLGDQFGKVLENQDIRVAYSGGRFHASYGGQNLPLYLESWALILEPALQEYRLHAPPGSVDLQRLEDVLLRVRDREGTYEERMEAISTRLRDIFQNGNGVRSALDTALSALNGRKGEPRSFDALETLLLDQPYRLSYWRVAADEVNYRRFFDINDLVAIRVEEPEVFQVAHDLVLGFVRKGMITGLRIDHVDGLLEPVHYLEQLVRQVREAGGDESFLVLVEKILDQNERLDHRWPVDGTTGYEFMNVLNGVFVEPSGLTALEAFYERFTGKLDSPQETINRSKRLILASSMAGELHVLAQKLDRISEQHRSSRDFTQKSLEAALAEVIACFPVYRTYADGRDPVGAYDRSIIELAVSAARHRNAATNASIFDFIQEVLLLQGPESLTEAQRKERATFLLRFQQLTGPVMAKGLEDTACYRRYPLASLCEVGGGPDRRPTPLEDFHEFNARRQARWGRSLSATSTHDTKRAEDVRARLNVLSELPEEWTQAVKGWSDLNKPYRQHLGIRVIPDANEEYLIYQTLAATLPFAATRGALPDSYLDRLKAYFTKALREARLHSSWLGPNEKYEEAVGHFLEAILAPDHDFLPGLRSWVWRIGPASLWNILGQSLLKVACPGIPDIYQGSELLDFRLADPDNRQPVDFGIRRSALGLLPGEPSREDARKLIEESDWEELKLLVTRQALRARRQKAVLFERGEYIPLEVRGPRSAHLLAFARRHAGDEVVALVGRFLAVSPETVRTGAFWEGTELPALAGLPYRDLLWSSGEKSAAEFALPRALSALPVALLERVR
ncbi:MAG: malto-oligosyltrehalose synthase [Planctomycetaceae bacterium]|nr:malto-oligosyltrehalose synthase [Planctomycetaceae bacterium]